MAHLKKPIYTVGFERAATRGHSEMLQIRQHLNTISNFVLNFEKTRNWISLLRIC